MPAPALVIDGAVDAPLELAPGALAREPVQVPDAGALVAGKVGKAAALGPLLERARPRPGATHATAAASDGNSMTLPLAVLREAWVAYDLPAGKGGPLRLLVPDAVRAAHPGLDDCAHVKQLVRLTLTQGADPAAEAAHRAQHARKGH